MNNQSNQQTFEVTYEYAPTSDAPRRIRRAYELIFERLEVLEEKEKVHE